MHAVTAQAATLRDFTVVIGLIMFMELVQKLHSKDSEAGSGLMRSFLTVRPYWLKWAVYCIAFWAILYFGVFVSVPFIYFKF